MRTIVRTILVAATSVGIAGLTNAAGAEIRQADPVSAPVPAVEKARERPVPRPAMAERLATDVDVIGIVHWGLNTYTDREWGYGDEDPAMLNPAKFDADQIVAACKAGGLKGLVVVAKHHDGFCLWPTKTTEHNITKTPFWEGTGNGEQRTCRDYVKEMEQACRRAGLRFGVYCSPWDRNSAHYATDRYVEIYHAQLKELLGGAYGDIFEMWFDGANGGDGYYGGAREKRKIGVDYYRFGEVFKFVRELQPNVTIFSGADDGSDLRWCGNERGYICDDSRATVVRTGGFCDGKFGNPDYVPTRNEGLPDGDFFRVNEADFPLRKGWFYHEGERGTTKSGAYLAKLYVGTVGNGGTMDIGVAPNKDGILDADDVKALRDFGELRKALFAHEAKDGGPFNVVVLREDVSNGELVDKWEFVADGKTILRGKSIGNKRIRLLQESVAAKGCAVRVLRGVGTPKVSYTLYCADQAVIDAILNAKGDDGETDTAKWMTKGVPARRETRGQGLYRCQVHRGGGRDTRPDNSLETFLWCWGHGVAPEADARLTKDGVAIAFHDPTLQRIARGISGELQSREIKDMTWDEIKDVDVGSYMGKEYASTRIATMDSIFAAMSGRPDRMLYLDEKGAPPEMMAEMARKHGVEKQIYYTSPDFRLMSRWQKVVSDGLGMVWLGTWPTDNSAESVARADEFLERTFREMEAEGWSGISQIQLHIRTDLTKPDPFCPSTECLKKSIELLHAKGLTVQAFTWTEGANKDVLRRLWSLGFDNFATDDPLVLFELLPEFAGCGKE